MDLPQQKMAELQCKTVIPQLTRRNMSAEYVPTAEAALARVQALLVPGETVATGGSATLDQCGITALLRSGAYRYLDRAGADTPEKRRQLLPFFGWFVIGAGLGKLVYRRKQSLLPRVNADFFLLRFLCFVGRHSLEIYLLHQPILSGITALLFS